MKWSTFHKKQQLICKFTFRLKLFEFFDQLELLTQAENCKSAFVMFNILLSCNYEQIIIMMGSISKIQCLLDLDFNPLSRTFCSYCSPLCSNYRLCDKYYDWCESKMYLNLN